METLDPAAVRVLGCLIEKAMTTPEYYPLTANALVAACNQRTNRDPVVDYDEATVDDALHRLESDGLVGITRSSGGRALKYVHKADTVLEVDPQQLSLLAVLMLRGVQTPGELRSRTDRYTRFEDVAAVEEVLEGLIHRRVPLVARIERGPGQKENRYRCLLTGEDESAPQTATGLTGEPTPDLAARVAALEERLARIEGELGIAP